VRIWSNVRGPEAYAVGKLSKLSLSLTDMLSHSLCYDTRLNDEISATWLADYKGTYAIYNPFSYFSLLHRI